ncbi:MAG: hypothetical protein IJF73_01050 [Clostridia bacterium]|nr:hypothetical protein [Clostridia bacterium]
MPTENPHKDHRGRLRRRFLSAGLSDFAPHNVLELLLFYAIPRRDTNPLAHALLDRFGTVDAVLSAGEEELCAVAGVGERTARLLRTVAAASAFDACLPRPRFSDAEALGSFFCDLLSPLEEGLAVAYLGNDFGLLSHRVLAGVDPHSPHTSVAALVGEGLLLSAPMCAVAHVHRDGLALPTTADLDLSRTWKGAMTASGVRLLESYIVSGDTYTTLLRRHSGKRSPTAGPLALPTPTEAERSLLASLSGAAGLALKTEELLGRYGGLKRLLSASAARHRYEGLDERETALLLLPYALHAYRMSERPVPAAQEREALGAHLADWYHGRAVEEVVLLLFDREGRHLATSSVGVGSVSEAALSCRRIAERALFSGASLSVMAHNHPEGVAAPSAEDRSATEAVRGALSAIGITFLGQYIVAGRDVAFIS